MTTGTIHHTKHPVNGRAARKAWNSPNLAELYDQRAHAQRNLAAALQLVYGGSGMTDTARMMRVFDAAHEWRREVGRLDRAIEEAS